jgi:hypothetical protein
VGPSVAAGLAARFGPDIAAPLGQRFTARDLLADDEVASLDGQPTEVATVRTIQGQN